MLKLCTFIVIASSVLNANELNPCLTMQIGPDQIEALYQYAKFQFECGNYSWAAEYLYQYRALCTDTERSVSALWGKLAAEILMQNWDVALEEFNRLKEIIDSKVLPSMFRSVFFALCICYISNLVPSLSFGRTSHHL
jgi:hypothetical protein